MRYLITGTAGFIGFHLAKRLLEEGHEVAGVDGMTPYYDINLKKDRHAKLERFASFQAHYFMLEDWEGLVHVAKPFRPDVVVHLAAQAGVRYSLENPRAYIQANIVGSFNIMELCREVKPRHLLIASTSSVYGMNTSSPLRETSSSDYPLTTYAATKKSVETLAHCNAHLWGIPTTILRFFSVYGPWGRPDMALFRFVQNILAGQPIDIYNRGQMQRDFTYVDDVIEAVVRLADCVPDKSEGEEGMASGGWSKVAPYRVVNVGSARPVGLLDLVEEIERALGVQARRNYMDMQLGDVVRTEAAAELLERLIGYRPSTPMSKGVREFVAWYRSYYQA
ncbi:NAD-dependent epimerase/dehydratase family protein [uncultured Reyranella sp.]|uniref:NAD-dependent epimerase/dehydratase family protein n=1 Tax=uncultured Reyranella sp. TaxID=735512 RepID=UPI0025F0E3A8|nr:NAD-dependent epimerase/dehydratase family protein [uncultured Reyranella sp.]